VPYTKQRKEILLGLTSKDAMEDTYKKVYVGFKFQHMGIHAGYDTVRLHAGYDIFLDCQRYYDFLNRQSFPAKCWRRLFGVRLWWVELLCLLRALRNRKLTFHFIYAENTYRYLGYFKWIGFRIVCTYHQQISFYVENRAMLKGVNYVDDVIVLDKCLVDFFKLRKGDDHVHYIPHGVDTHFFCPDPSIIRRREILMVGNWSRNFSFAAEVLHHLIQIDPLVECHVVAGREQWHHFNTHERIHLYCDISDSELLYRYRRTALLFLPLHSFVANNAVLEALSVGCNVLIATTQESCIFLDENIERVPLILNEVEAKILARLDVPDNNAINSRQDMVREFSWRAIGDKVRIVLERNG
jgi:glycosyltransferase involved in cell wall biosynthesis